MNRNIGLLLFVFIAVLLLFMAGSACFNLYIDWLFFQETGFLSVFKTMLSTKVISALLFSGAFLVFYLLNIIMANRARFPVRNIHIFSLKFFHIPDRTSMRDQL